MRLGIAASFPHSSPEEWAAKHSAAGLGAVVFPLGSDSPAQLVDGYAKAAAAYGLKIAEVGIWRNVFDPDEKKRAENRAYARRQLELAEYVGAACCVNISGAKGEVWDGFYPDNYSDRTYAEIVEYARSLLDDVKPVRTKFTLEPMPHMLPDSPDSYLELIRDVDRPGFGAHIDIVNMIVSPRTFIGSGDLIRETFSKLGPHVTSCHLKDAVLEHGLTVSIKETDCGRGGTDLSAYIAEADKVSRDMPMIIEHLSDLGRYADSVGYIKTLAGKLGVRTDG